MKAIFVALLVLLGVSAALCSTEHEELQKLLDEFKKEHTPHVSSREGPVLEEELSDRANLLFRTLDKNRDRAIDAKDVMEAKEELQRQIPGITPEDFIAFISVADTNRDKKLSHAELMHGFAKGLQSSVMLETNSVQKSMAGLARSMGSSGSSTGSSSGSEAGAGEDACVMCQFIVERCETNVKQSGVIPSMSQAVTNVGVMLELETKVAEKTEAKTEDKAEAGVEAEQNPFDVSGAGIIGSTRQSTRYQRQLERQKYNEIYRVVDITLDDVCEQGMPNTFYGFCKQVYAVQSDVVDGLRYQYRPADICYRIGMCAKGSYITKGIHSRYKEA